MPAGAAAPSPLAGTAHFTSAGKPSSPIRPAFRQAGIAAGGQGMIVKTNIQPVIPVSISQDWNMISRTILPVVSQQNIAPGSGSQFGLGDTTQSLFFSPAKPGRVIWGVGPAMLIPT